MRKKKITLNTKLVNNNQVDCFELFNGVSYDQILDKKQELEGSGVSLDGSTIIIHGEGMKNINFLRAFQGVSFNSLFVRDLGKFDDGNFHLIMDDLEYISFVNCHYIWTLYSLLRPNPMKLKNISLDNLLNLVSFRGIEQAPNLQCVSVHNCRKDLYIKPLEELKKLRVFNRDDKAFLYNEGEKVQEIDYSS